VCWAAERDFPSEARTPGAARQFLSSQLLRLLAPLRDAEAIHDAELVVSELVTNAVRAGAGTVRVALRLHHGELEVAVADDGPGWPTLMRPGEQDAHGRGLVLVDALAESWRTERIDSGGKRVRVTIAVADEFTRSLRCDRPRSGAAERES